MADLRNDPVRVDGKRRHRSGVGRMHQHRPAVVVRGPAQPRHRRPVARWHEPRGICAEVENGRIVRIALQSEVPVGDQDRMIRVVDPHATGEFMRGLLAEPGLGSHRRQQHRSIRIHGDRGLVQRATRDLATEFESRHGARGRDELIAPQPGEHDGRRTQSEPFHAAQPDAIRRPPAPPIHVRRGSAGRQQTMRRCGGQVLHP